MKKLLLVIILSVGFIFTTTQAQAKIGDGKKFLGCSTLHYPDENMRAIFEEHIFPNPDIIPVPLSETFRLDINYLMMAENATIMNVVASHPWWQIKDKKISTEKGISVVSFTISGSWNPSNQPVQDWPGGMSAQFLKLSTRLTIHLLDWEYG